MSTFVSLGKRHGIKLQAAWHADRVQSTTKMKGTRPILQHSGSAEAVPGLRRGGLLAASAVATSALVTLCSVAATIIALRVLSPSEAGRFAFLVELLYSIGLLGSLGQSTLHARIYQQSTAEYFDWRKDAWSAAWMTAPVIIIAVLALVIPYQLTAFQVTFLCLGGEIFVLTNCFSAVLAQQQHYAWSAALLRMGNGLLIVPALLMLANASLRHLNFILLSLLVFLGATSVIGGVVLARRLKAGNARINIRQRVYGLIFLASLLSILAPQRGLIVVAGTMLSAENVAALAALAIILRVFDLIGEPAGRVFSTEMARHPDVISRGLLFGPWLAAGAISAGLLVFLPPVAHHFYAGRYDSAIPLLGWLIAAGALRFIEIVPRGFLSYLAPTRLLNRFTAAQCACAIAGLVVMVKWTGDYGLRGLVCAGASIAAVRVAISYLFFALVRRHRLSESAATRDGLIVEALETGSKESPI